MATNDLKSPPVKKAMPTRFWAEYQHSITQHTDKLSNLRTMLEKHMCKDKLVIARRLADETKRNGVDGLDEGDKELVDVQKTLKAFKNSLHVYGGKTTTAKKKDTDGESKTTDGEKKSKKDKKDTDGGKKIKSGKGKA